MKTNKKPTHEDVLAEFARILEAGRRAADIVAAEPDSDAAARAMTALKAARNALEKGVA